MQAIYFYSWGRRCRSNQVRGDDLVLLTRKPPPKDASAGEPPKVHIIALINKVNREEGGGGSCIAHALVNLISGNTGV